MEKYTAKQLAFTLGIGVTLYQKIADKEGETLHDEEYQEHQEKTKKLLDVLNAFSVDVLGVLMGDIVVTDLSGKDMFNELVRDRP